MQRTYATYACKLQVQSTQGDAESVILQSGAVTL